LTGYEDEHTLQWDQAVMAAYARLTAAPHGALATAEPSRLAKALDLARSGSVQIEDTYIWVHGATGEYSWTRPDGRCTCQDAKRSARVRCNPLPAAPTALEARQGRDEPLSIDLDPEVLPAAIERQKPPVAEPLLPEAAFSLSLKVSVLGKEGQLTVRGQTVAQFTTHLQTIRALLEALGAAEGTSGGEAPA